MSQGVTFATKVDAVTGKKRALPKEAWEAPPVVFIGNPGEDPRLKGSEHLKGVSRDFANLRRLMDDPKVAPWEGGLRYSMYTTLDSLLTKEQMLDRWEQACVELRGRGVNLYLAGHSAEGGGG